MTSHWIMPRWESERERESLSYDFDAVIGPRKRSCQTLFVIIIRMWSQVFASCQHNSEKYT